METTTGRITPEGFQIPRHYFADKRNFEVIVEDEFLLVRPQNNPVFESSSPEIEPNDTDEDIEMERQEAVYKTLYPMLILLVEETLPKPIRMPFSFYRFESLDD